MRYSAIVLFVCAWCSVWLGMPGRLPGAEPAFAEAPSFRGGGEGGTVTFSADRETDAEVAILDAKDKVVRRLAAGMLGANAPEPFAKGALKQAIAWDGKDDLGQPVQGGPFKARVRLGFKPAWDATLGRDPRTLGYVSSVAVGRDGELFVVLSDYFWGRSEVRVYSREGKYLRTVLPYAAKTPAERTASVGHVMQDGERLPIVFNGHSHNLSPLVAGLRQQTMAVHPTKGYLTLFSGTGSMADQGAPRHLLAIHPQGGAPEGVAFVGPELTPPRNFLGSAGDARSRFYDHVAFSPDGEWLYVTMSWLNPGEDDPRRVLKPRHAVFRLKWSDKELGKPFLGVDGEAGAGEAHFNDPQGVACDARGNLYVCDRGNNRLRIFSADGKALGQVTVDQPTHVCVHGTTGVFYVLSRAAAKQVKGTELVKFDAWKDGAAKELARIKLGSVEAISLDAGATPPKLWCAVDKKLVPVADDGASLTPGTPVGDNEAGLEYPIFLAADPARNRVIVRERSDWLYAVDMQSNKIKQLPVKGTDVALDRAGNLYVMDGQGSLVRYDPAGKPLPFSALKTHKIKLAYRSYGPNLGLRGHCVADNGDIYVLCSTNYGTPETMGGHLHVFNPDGSTKKEDLIPGLAYGDCGIGVDLKGNVYVGVNIKPGGQALPAGWEDKVSGKPWLWWRKGEREAPGHYMFCNPYLFYWGSVLKFPPAGGKIYGHDICKRETPRDVPTMSAEKAPAGAVAYKSSYLGRDVKVEGALWGVHGFGPIPGSSDGPAPDPGCVCFPFHMDADGYGRVFVPNAFRFCVEVLDTNGNRIGRIGRYGNADDEAAGLHFAWPAYVSLAQEKAYVSDPVNRQVTVVKLGFAAEKVVAITP